MKVSWDLVLTIARREYLTTVRRKAFVFSVIGIPALYTFLMFIMIKPQINEAMRSIKSLKTLAVVDSSGLFAQAPSEIATQFGADQNPFSMTRVPLPTQTFHTEVRPFPDQGGAEAALRSEQVDQVLVIPADYLRTGKLRRYARSTSMFSSADERTVTRWLVRSLLARQVDSLRIERVARPTRAMNLYTLDKTGQFELKDDRREMLDFFVPFVFALLMGMSIVIGGQYLLQGVAEEKESRILESMLCTVNAEELLAGKLIGLGGAGLTLVGAWIGMGAAVAVPGALMTQLHVSQTLLVLGILYFLLGYLFYGSLMTGIGAITNNMREAQQFSFLFTFMNFIPFYLMTPILAHPDSGLAMGLTFFPPMAPVAMMLRLAAPSSAVPPWQIAVSIALMIGATWLAITAAARVFRIGLLMHGKTPNLPEILRWARQG